jgi:hypothetical protein
VALNWLFPHPLVTHNTGTIVTCHRRNFTPSMMRSVDGSDVMRDGGCGGLGAAAGDGGGEDRGEARPEERF